MKRTAWIPVAVSLVLVAIVHTIVRAQQVLPDTTLTGVLTSVWGDPNAGDPQAGEPRLMLHLTDARGTTTLDVPDSVLEAAGGLRALDGRQVSVTATGSAIAAGARVGVRAIRLATPQEISVPIDAPQALTGSQPRVLILCRFGDSTGTTPKQPSYFTGLMGASWPGLNHYWWEVSYHNVDLNGTVVYGWYNLPQPRSYYVYDRNGDGSPDLDFARAAADCTGVADADVYFPNYSAIDLNFNQDLDCCAWGGRWTVNRDGVSRTYGMTWMPPWSQDAAVYAHESGHSLGFPHSSGPYSQTYDSRWDPMSDAWASCRTPHSLYGCVPVHTIMHHKDLDLWIPTARRFDAPPDTSATIQIESSAQPDPSGYLFAKIPIGSSTTHFYTVEARRFADYDNEIPAGAIVIHDVLTTRSDRVAQVVDADNDGDPNDDGAMWTPGESFVDAVNGITVTVNAHSGTGYTVTISNGISLEAVSVSPNTGTGSRRLFTLAYTDSAGVTADLTSARVRFAVEDVTAGTCLVRYNATNGAIALQDDAGTGWLRGTLGSGTLTNTQCTVNLASSTATANGSNLTLVLDISFYERFGGLKQISMMAVSAGGATTGWHTRGTWMVPQPTLSATSVTPGSGSGISHSFTSTYSDSAGVTADLIMAQVRFTNIASGATCVIHYRATTGAVRLQDDAGAWGAWAPFGSGMLANSRCSLNLATSSATPNGNDLSMTLDVTFAGAFSGPADIAIRAGSLTGANTGWINRGTWTVGAVLDAIAISPGSGTGMSGTFTATFSDSLGVVSDLKSAQIRFGTSNVSGCVVQYNAMTGKVRLVDDAGVAGAFTDFGSGTLSNSQCQLDLAQSSAAPSGNGLALTVRLSFTASFAGTKTVSLRGISNFGSITTGFVERGTWTVAPLVDPMSITPIDGSAGQQSFTLQYSDTAGVTTDLKGAKVRFAGSNAAKCVVDYNATTGLVRLQDDAGAWGPFVALGNGTPIGNSQCSFDPAQSSATATGTNLSLTLHLTFTAAFTGSTTVSMRADSLILGNGPWVVKGSWNVP